jgi:undecaprenyl-diphosphatase
MEWWQAVLLGAIQGLTEFLPISSSGHLLVAQDLLNVQLKGKQLDAFDVALHLGTLTAVISYFRDDLTRMAKAVINVGRTRAVKTTDERLGVLVMLGTFPAIIVYGIFKDTIQSAQDNFLLIGFMLISFCAVFAIADMRTSTKKIEQVRWRHALTIGFAQALALIPGTSRSGATISAGMLMGFDRPTAARFSFLLSVPIVLAATLLTLPDLASLGSSSSSGIFVVVLGAVSAGLTGYLAIAGLLKFLGGHALSWFSLYRIPVGIALIAYYWQ